MDATGLPTGWEVRHSNSKNLPYYFNPSTRESTWEPPSGTDSETLKTYMAKHHSSHAQPIRQEGGASGKIRAAHLLIKHNKSRNPSSWKESNITRTKEEAEDIINQHKDSIINGDTTLQDLAVTESDCSSARKRGDLGFFSRGQMQKPFEDAAFELQPKQMSGVVESASGLHLIQRLE